MNITETLLKNLSAGELQQLACEVLERIHKNDWGIISQSGGCEGGFRTRKGTPDMWCTTNESDDYICIQATADSANGKLYNDLCKSVETLVEMEKNEGATCISFINYDPNIEEVKKCMDYCKMYKCKYKLYHNRRIAKIIDTKYPDLRIKFINLNVNNDIIDIPLMYDSFQKEIEYIFQNIECEDKEYNSLLAVTIMELAKNAFEHGNASKVKLLIKENNIKFIDNGNDFNLYLYKGKCKLNGGGKYTLEYFLNKYQDKVNYNYQYINGENIISFDSHKNIKYKLDVDNTCSVNIPETNYLAAKKTDYIFSIPKHCDVVRLRVVGNFMALSDFGYIINKLIRSIPQNYKIEIVIDKEKMEFVGGFVIRCFDLENGRISLKVG
ncbi:hypothetical protein [Clostridium beijerinckii]|uniref:hypothetical protein n=1 Tax=Clostridium beijerinckii TaxID=1520 RepID=UPI0024306D7A|nr:hypothetical protein [Clostridium beijerinckii]MDG5852450.1 hypothetical protein [Clostridium beijerinckii]